jgi:hypothetical protein
MRPVVVRAGCLYMIVFCLRRLICDWHDFIPLHSAKPPPGVRDGNSLAWGKILGPIWQTVLFMAHGDPRSNRPHISSPVYYTQVLSGLMH